MPQDAGLITLIRTTTGWSARFSGDAGQYIRSLFGTDIIPTAFTLKAEASKVEREIRAQWPKCIVTVQEGF